MESKGWRSAVRLALLTAAVGCAPTPASETDALRHEDAAYRNTGNTGNAGDALPGTSASDRRAAAVADPADFSSERAWDHLESLASVGPRPANGPQADAARRYLGNRLAASGLRLEEIEFEVALPGAAGSAGGSAAVRHIASLLARLDGPSEDLILVAAPFTSSERDGAVDPGVNEGASGAAVALELARALAEGERRYTYLFAFIAGDGVEADPIAGSRELAQELSRRGVLDRVRAAMFLDRVGSPRLRIARDLYSSGPYRDIVWEQAIASGHADAFASEGFDATDGGHRALAEAGLRQLVAIIDADYAGAGASDPAATGRRDDVLSQCDVASLGIVGHVALDSLRAIEQRLDRLDRYSAAPAATTRSSELDREAASLDAGEVQAGPARNGEAAP